jgi:hypothetical protein
MARSTTIHCLRAALCLHSEKREQGGGSRQVMAQQLVKLLRGVKPADTPIEQPTSSSGDQSQDR